MTSLRTFQTEIDEISHREVAKQRAHASAERAKLEKDAAAKKSPSTKTSHAHTRRESTDASDAVKVAAKEAVAVAPVAPASGDAPAMSDIDEQLQVRPRLRVSHLPLADVWGASGCMR